MSFASSIGGKLVNTVIVVALASNIAFKFLGLTWLRVGAHWQSLLPSDYYIVANSADVGPEVHTFP